MKKFSSIRCGSAWMSYCGVACHVRHHASGSRQELQQLQLCHKNSAAVLANASVTAQMIDRMIPSITKTSTSWSSGSDCRPSAARRGGCCRLRLDRVTLHGLLRLEDELLLP
jgi:hypothetical protein